MFRFRQIHGFKRKVKDESLINTHYSSLQFYALHIQEETLFYVDLDSLLD